ncbi:heavy metal sensor histidine kinase [Occallatibacter savannae]|uniref:heavy metal sensor histidine kinase n=1 Tax=Occallatibacter savannae TaxID=1002691 RepID=UPI000D69E713|nr:heavy metal sensor histidine kinase [Occallatibacter savannae]
MPSGRQLRTTLAFRLAAAYSLAGLLLVILITVSLYLLLRSELDRSNELFLADKINVLRTMLRERPNDDEALREEIELESAARRYEQFYIRLLDQHGSPILTTPDMNKQLDITQFSGCAHGNVDRSTTLTGMSGRIFRISCANAAVGNPPNQIDKIEIAIDISQSEGLLARYRMWFSVSLMVTSILFPLAGYKIARHGIQPVEEIAATVRKITSTNLRERLRPEGYPSELASLAGTFNQMLDRLKESFERISQFSADIAHDLRTPVNNIRGEAEVALARARTVEEYRGVLESSLEETVRLSDLIGDLLFLARAERPLTELRREDVNLCHLLNTVRDYYEAPAADAGVSLSTREESDQIIASMDRALMLRAISNLVSNAIAHTPRGGSITLAAYVHEEKVCIDVSDTGAGIPAAALPKVFDRFFRVDPSRSHASGGTGLGLSIVQSIMLLHAGSAEITSNVGRGTTVSLVFNAPAKR